MIAAAATPFIPVIDGEIVACPQLPTTLPTLDEILALEPGLSADQAADRILQLAKVLSGDHVFTLRAELEGTLFTDAFTRLLTGWRETGFALVALRDIRSTLEINALPRHTIHLADIPGRLGKRMIQGPAFSIFESKTAASRPFFISNKTQSRLPAKAISRLSKLTKTL